MAPTGIDMANARPKTAAAARLKIEPMRFPSGFAGAGPVGMPATLRRQLHRNHEFARRFRPGFLSSLDPGGPATSPVNHTEFDRGMRPKGVTPRLPAAIQRANDRRPPPARRREEMGCKRVAD